MCSEFDIKVKMYLGAYEKLLERIYLQFVIQARVLTQKIVVPRI